MRTKYEWLKIFEEQEKSNLNEKEYCKIHSINLHGNFIDCYKNITHKKSS